MKRTEHAAKLAAHLAADLFDAEASQDEAVSQLGKLAQSLTRTRREARLSTTMGQGAFDALADAIAAQVQAQRAMVALHHALSDVKQSSSFRGIALSGHEKESNDPTRPIGRLALVS
jgi:hypothetical protein